MLSSFRQLDELLRGRKTRPEQLAENRVDLPLRTFVPLAVVLGVAYGFFMGWYGVFNRDPARYMQMLASMVKIPALFLLTLFVTFPSLYVFNALVGCRLTLMATQRLLVGAIVVNIAVAASLGPILGFFTLSTTSYSFMILLNVALLGVAGVVGLAFLLHTLRRIVAPPWARPAIPPAPEPAQPDVPVGTEDHAPNPENSAESPPRQPGPLDPVVGEMPDEALGQARLIFRIWVVLYGLVGAQMGWLLRPFIGSPDLEFTWFRARQGNFFLAVFQQIENLFSGL
jgi:hypothetical protein